ncbi:MAG: alginate lyase family protein [Halioglobus sp.]|nr:alginate lyase family protein [Halioglobus sp.]
MTQQLQTYLRCKSADYRKVTPLDLGPKDLSHGLVLKARKRLNTSTFSEYLKDVSTLIANDSERRNQFMKYSDSLICGSVVVYDRAIELGEGLDWNVDITGEGTWPNIFYTRYRRLLRNTSGKHGDFRFTWELNRQQHLLGLSIASRITSNKEYARCIVKHILSWIEKNPVFCSLNWISSMEIGLRLVSWSLSLAFLEEGSIEADDEDKILVSMYQQMRFLCENLSVDIDDQGSDTELKNNHTIVELSALIVFFELFPDFLKAAGVRYRKHGLIKSLLDELNRQTHSDGMHVEQASSYLRFVLEALILVRLIVDGSEGLDVYISCYLKSLTVFRYDKDRIVIVGDEDNGHVLVPTYEASPDSIEVCLSMFKALCSTSDFSTEYGVDASEWDDMAQTCSSLTKSGHWMSRVHDDNGRYSVYFRSGPMDFPRIPGYAPHAHCDLLSINVCVDGLSWFVDRGTYSYHEKSISDAMRLGAAHNVILVGDAEQMRILGSFHSDNHARGEMFESSPLAVAGRIKVKKDNRIICIMRKLEISKEIGRLLVHDVISGLSGENVVWFLNLHPAVQFEGRWTFRRYGSKRRLRLQGWESAELRQVPYSPRYGVLEQASQLVLEIPSAKRDSFEYRWSVDFGD